MPWLLGLLVVHGVEVVALLASAGPRRGIELLTRRHWSYLAIAAVPAAMIQASGLGAPPGRLDEAIALTGTGAIVILVLACWLSSGTGKRLAVLLAVLAYPSLLLLGWQFGQPFRSYRAYETYETGASRSSPAWRSVWCTASGAGPDPPAGPPARAWPDRN